MSSLSVSCPFPGYSSSELGWWHNACMWMSEDPKSTIKQSILVVQLLIIVIDLHN